jgi:hypothetical protein
MPKGANHCVSVGASFELARLNPGENTVAVEHQNSPSNSVKLFQFGTKSQIASGQLKNAECFRITTFKKSFPQFSIRKKSTGEQPHHSDAPQAHEESPSLPNRHASLPLVILSIISLQRREN